MRLSQISLKIIIYFLSENNSEIEKDREDVRVLLRFG